MQNNEQNKAGKATVGYTGSGQGMQGVDKVPGQETASGNEDMIKEAQKGKNKVDGDPSQESDQPINQP